MNPALANDPEALRVDLTLPSSRVSFGALSLDPVQLLLGRPLSEILGSLMRGPQSRRTTPTGAALDVFPLAIPDGEGLSFPVRLQGEVGFRNHRGLLVLIVPAAVSEAVREQLAEELAQKTAAGPRLSQGSAGPIAEYAFRLRPGARKSIPLGTYGEIGIEAAT